MARAKSADDIPPQGKAKQGITDTSSAVYSDGGNDRTGELLCNDAPVLRRKKVEVNKNIIIIEEGWIA